MIHILSKDDVSKVSDPVLVAGINREFERLPDDYMYPEYGYFIVIETVEEWNDSVELNALISQYTARSFDECVELVEEFEGYSQVVLILNADFGVSLFVSDELMSIEQLKVYCSLCL